MVAKEDVDRVLEFASLENIKKELVDEKKRFTSTRANVNFNGHTFGCRISIAKIDIKDDDKSGYKFICLFNVETIDK